MLMAWLAERSGAEVVVVHAAPQGGGLALCGDRVDCYGEVWPFPAVTTATAPEGRTLCAYCLRLMQEG